MHSKRWLEAPCDPGRIVAAAIADDDHLVALARLSQQALQGLPDNRCLVMRRNDDCRHVDSIQSVQHP